MAGETNSSQYALDVSWHTVHERHGPRSHPGGVQCGYEVAAVVVTHDLKQCVPADVLVGLWYVQKNNAIRNDGNFRAWQTAC